MKNKFREGISAGGIKMKEIKIDPVFKELIPPLSEDEFAGLEESIMAHGGCRDTIKIWKDNIVDGHNRYAICQKHGLLYNTQDMRFSSRKDAELWIIQNQLGRRNLVKAQIIKLVLHKEAILKEKARQNRSGSGGSPVHTRKALAKEAGVSEQTVYRYMKIRELGTPKLLRKVDLGHEKIGTAYRGLKYNREVITRTVEPLPYTHVAHDTSNPRCRAEVFTNISKLMSMIGFIFDRMCLMGHGDDVDRVVAKLQRMRRDVKVIIKS